MSQDELLDLVNEEDEIIGEVWKSEAHRNPTRIHREVALVVFNTDGEVLLQQRSKNKSIKPGKWEVAAAGHVEKGEDPEKSIKREAFEELGLKIKPVFFTKVLQRRDNKETRFFWVYYSVLKELPKLKLDRSEVSDARWVKIGDLEEFAEDNYYNLDGLSHKLITELSQHLKI